MSEFAAMCQTSVMGFHSGGRRQRFPEGSGIGEVHLREVESGVAKHVAEIREATEGKVVESHDPLALTQERFSRDWTR